MTAEPAELRASALERWLSVLSVRPGEGRKTLLLFCHLLLASAVFILGRTVRDTLFLSRYPIDALPWMFVLYGVASAITAVIYGRYADRIARHVLIGTSAAIGIGTYIGVWALVRLGASWIYPVFYVWSEVAANLFIVQFWTLANDLNDPRSAKRLFGFIGSARVLGTVVIGTSTGVIVRAIGTEQLLFVLAALMALIGVVAYALQNEKRAEAPHPPAHHGRAPSVVKNPYVQALAVFLLLAFTALTVGDYQFKVIARATYREDRLAEFFSLFYAVTGIVSFVFQLVITPRLLRRLGAGWGMSVMPGVFGAASITLPFFPTLPVASVMKFADNGFQYTIHDTTLQALYVPFPAQVKAKTRALLDAVVKPCSYGAGGLVLILLARRLDVGQLSYVTAVVVLSWLAIVPVVRRRYLAALKTTLSTYGSLEADSEFLLDAAGRDALMGVLEDGQPRQVLAALEQLENDRSPELARALGRLLQHPHPEVRKTALRLACALPDAAPDIATRAVGDPDPQVQAAAARALADLRGDAAVPELTRLLDSEHQDVRVAALAGLSRRGGVDGQIAAGQRLSQLLSGPAPARIEAARVLSELSTDAFRPLRELLSDDEPAVRRAALKACQGVADPRLSSDLIELLRDPACRVRASSALVAIGAPSMEQLFAALVEPSTPRAVRLLLPRILRRIPSRDCYLRLRELVDVEDSHQRLRIFAALSTLRSELGLPPEPRDWLERLLQSEIRRGYRNLAAWEAIKSTLATPLLAEEMRFRHQRAVKRVLRILELRFERPALHLVRDRIRDSRRRANAIEVLDALLDPPLRPLVMPFFDDTPVSQRLAAAGALAPEALTVDDFAREEVEHPNPYVALVVYDSLARRLPSLAGELAERGLARREPLVREGALLALLAADPARARQHVLALCSDPDPTLRQHAESLLGRLDQSSENRTMHSTVEKILILKSAPVFEKVSGEDLAPLARVASEEVYGDGERVFEEGEVGDSLFVVVRGTVAIVHEGETVATLDAGEAFGEMAVLDSAPRSATAEARGEVELLRIGSEEFYEILHEQVEIAEGVIRMLTQRLRESTAQLSRDRAERLTVA